MAYYADLSPYKYTDTLVTVDSLPVLNVGRLAASNPFPVGDVSNEFKEKLFIHCQDQFLVNLMHGWHCCQPCNLPDEEWLAPYFHAREGERYMNMGNGEVRVIGRKVIYAAPALVYHYVTIHRYCPPDGFIEAVLTGPQPDSDEHYSLIEAYILDVYKRTK
jgi:hypothetical protein